MSNSQPIIVWNLSWLTTSDTIALKVLFPTTQVSVLDSQNGWFLGPDLILLLKSLGESPKVEIKRMNLMSNLMGDDEITALANYIPQSKLEYLHLEHNFWTLAGTTALANALPKTRTLKYLNLRNNQIGPEGASILAEKVKENKSLETLLLGNNWFEKYIWEDVKNVKELQVEDDGIYEFPLFNSYNYLQHK